MDWQDAAFPSRPQLDPARLAELWPPGDVQIALDPLVDGYAAWIGQQRLRVPTLEPLWVHEDEEGFQSIKFDGTGPRATPTVEAGRVYVMGGTGHVNCLDAATGGRIWHRNVLNEYGAAVCNWGKADSPLVVDDLVVVTGGGGQGPSLIALNKETGAVVWEAPGTTMNAIPSPVHADGIVYLMSGFRGNNLKAIRLSGAKGDLTGTSHILWELNRDTPYVPSPLLYDGILYFLKTNNGLLSAFDAASGKPHYQLQRLDKAPNVFSSPVGAAGRVYIAGREGTTIVFRHGPKYEVLAENVLDDGFDASPALVGKEIFLRGYTHLYCIAAG